MPIYNSHYPPTPKPATSIYTFLFSKTSPHSIYGKYPPSSPAFVDAASGLTLTRADVRTLTLQLAHSLKQPPAPLAPLHRGDIVLVFSPNSLAWPIVLWGIVAAGAAATLANPAYTPAELAHQYTDSRAGLIFVHPELLHVVLAMLESVGVHGEEARKRVVVMQYAGGRGSVVGGKGAGDAKDFLWLEELLGRGELPEEERFDGEAARETAFLCYSSGTTGRPKGVMTTHLNTTSVNLMLQAGFPPVDPKKDVFIAVLPFYHIYGLANLLQFPLITNIPSIIMPRFDPEKFCSYVDRYKVTVAMIVPPILLVLVHHPATMRYNMTSLRFISCGAAPLGRQLVAAAYDKMASVGAIVNVAQGYGLTETSPVTHQLLPGDAKRKIGSCGPLLANLEARIVVESDDGTERDAPEWDPAEDGLGGPGVRVSGRGELWLRGVTIMKGYHRNASATAHAITPDGWFKTGDIAARDEEGFWYVVDRKKELIKYKGFQVAPAELEALLVTHPKIVDVAVIGVEDSLQATELPRAYVVPASPQASPAAFEKEVQDWLESRVAYHKKLRGGVIIVDSIPAFFLSASLLMSRPCCVLTIASICSAFLTDVALI